MSTKKQNRRYVVRSLRRALNRLVDCPSRLSIRRGNVFQYGGGARQRHIDVKHDMNVDKE